MEPLQEINYMKTQIKVKLIRTIYYAIHKAKGPIKMKINNYTAHNKNKVLLHTQVMQKICTQQC